MYFSRHVNYYYYTCLMACDCTAWVSQDWKGKTSLDLNEVTDDEVLG